MLNSQILLYLKHTFVVLNTAISDLTKKVGSQKCSTVFIVCLNKDNSDKLGWQLIMTHTARIVSDSKVDLSIIFIPFFLCQRARAWLHVYHENVSLLSKSVA